MQWSNEDGASFSRTTPWIAINSNYEAINYNDQLNDDQSVRAYYKELIALRASSDTLKYGEFISVYANRHVMVYARVLEGEIYFTILNFSDKARKLDIPLGSNIVLSNVARQSLDTRLQPYEAILLRGSIEEKRNDD